MGFDVGTFKDRDGNTFEVEASCGLVIVSQCPGDQVLRLDPEEADKLWLYLDIAIGQYLSKDERPA